MFKLHLDTDIGGEIDDLCALAMVLNWPEVELLAVTTNSDDQGRRAGYARYVLDLADRKEVAVAAGADASLGCYRVWPGLPDDLINFLHDPLACAIALGWEEGVEVRELPLKSEIKDGWLHQSVDGKGKPTRVISRVAGEKFNEFWLGRVIHRDPKGSGNL